MIVALYTKKFDKQLEKLSEEDKKAVLETVELFLTAPQHPSLKKHKLHGKMDGSYALCAGYDLRVIYMYKDNKMIVVFVAVGKHDEVYT